MFSTEIPSGPSSPCKPSSPLRADETLELQSSDFSIRDYVFKFRREDIATSWPFPQQLLNLCLKHGISDPLPPFEPPDRVRDQCGLKAEEVDQTTSCLRAEEVSPQIDPTDAETCDIKSKTWLQSTELVVDCSDQAQYPSSEALKQKSYLIDVSDDETSCEGNVETVPAVKNQDKIERADKFGEQVHRPGRVIRSDKGKQLAIEVAEAHPLPSKLNILHYSPVKKFKSIVRLNSTSEIDRSEDRLYSSSTVSDPMASKVCPVCKIFSSTSNTTLNAHIDQCLSADCKRVEKVVTKNLEPKVKPSKKRLMVDVYATSLPYTLEDLDNRNGTNWASELALMIRTSEANSSAVKRLKLSPEDNRDEEEQAEVSPSDDTKDKEKQAEVSPSDDNRDEEKPAEVRLDGNEVRLDGNEGAVYVDSNGIKLRILSKFNDTLPVIPMKNFKLKKHAKKMDDNNPLIAKKKCFGSKYLKVKQKTMKLSSSESFKGEIQVAREAGYDVNTHMEKEESPSEIPNNSDKTRDSGSATLRNWICSKRSDLPKKLNHKDGKGKFMNINQPDISNSFVVKSHISKLSSPSEGLTISPKIKRVDLLSNNVETDKSGKSLKPPTFNPKWSSKSNYKNGLVLRKCRSMGTSSPTPSRREEIHTSTLKSDDSLRMTMHSPWSSHLQLKTKRSLSLKTKALFGGQSSVERSNGDITNTLSISKTIRKPRSFLGTSASQRRRPGLDAVRTMRTPQSDRSMNFTRPREEVLCPESPSSTTISESEDEEYKYPVENQKYKLSKLHNPVTACRDSISDSSDIQVELLSSSIRKGVANPAVSEATNPAVSEALAPTSSTKSDRLPSLDGNVHSSCDSDAHAEPSFVNMCNEQAVQCYKDSRSNGLSNNEGLRGEGYTSAAQYGTCQAQTASIQETSACLTSYAIHDIPREVSSITSFRRTSGHHRNLAIDSEQSGSPISNASTISRSSHKDSEFRNHGADTLLRPIVQDKLPSAIPSDERRNREVKAFHLVKEYEKSSDQPCCCSRNGGLPGQSQLLRQHGHAERVLPSEGKWVSHLYVTANTSSSLNSCTNQRIDFGVTPVLESPTESVTTRASADSVAKVLTCTDFSSPSPSPRTPTQSTSNSILRLMGKNLMVVNKEESTEPSTVYRAPEIPSSAQCLRPPVFPANNGSAIFSHALHSPNTQVGGYPGSWLSGVKMKLDQQIHNNMLERTSVSYLPPREALSSAQANMTKDVIEIDDSSESNIRVPPVLHPTNLMHQRPFTCFPSEGQFISRDADNALSLYPNVCPRGYANNIMQGNGSEVRPPRPPVPLAFQTPPGQFVPRFYYSQMLR